MLPELLLAKLVSYPSVVGTSNAALMDFVREYLAGHGVECRVISGPEGDRFNLFATVGPPDLPGYILSGHVDVVPADEPQWKGNPFSLRHEGDRLIGRGACDMKGFVAAVLSAVDELVQMNLGAPIHIALSYDEEAGCKGVPHLINRLPVLCAPPLGCIVGEPTSLAAVLRHKGKSAVHVQALGRTGHSSRPDLGSNAIHKLLPALQAAATASEAARRGPQDPEVEPPYSTLQIGTISGGQAVNIIPDRATARIEARAIAGVDPVALLAPVFALADEDLKIELMSSYPALSLSRDAPLAVLLEALTGCAALPAVSFGTEAGLFEQAGIPSIICGPGHINRAHKPEEFLTMSELHSARQLVIDLGRHLCRNTA